VESLYTTSVSVEFVAALDRAERLPEVAAQLVFLLAEGADYPAPLHVSGNTYASLFLQLGHLERIRIPLSVREVTAASLRPNGLPLVLRGSAGDWAGQQLIPFEDVLGHEARELMERMLVASTEQRPAVLQRFLERRMTGAAAPNGMVAQELRFTMQSQGALSVSDVAERCGCSARRLHQVTVQNTGLTPKQLARIARARHLLDVLVSSAKLTEAAMVTGFFDHPHLSRECQALFGCTPGELSEAVRKAPALEPSISTNRQLLSTGLALVPRSLCSVRPLR
jgi:AraC-like DNA-binding protein